VPSINFVAKYTTDLTSVLSPSDLRNNYLFGIDLSKNGQVVNDDLLTYHINAATESIERELNIKLSKTVIDERKDFYGDDWKTWGYMKASYPIVCPLGLNGYLGTIKQVQYPLSWLSSRKTSDGKLYSRLMYMVPNTGASYSEVVVFTGLVPLTNGYGQSTQIPNYWQLQYITGFDKVPKDILNAVGKLATINVLMVASDFLIRTPGVSSQSVSLDGLSQSTSLFVNGQTGMFGSRVKQYSEELTKEIANLRNYYSDILMVTC
jgi:hypothetical protein